MVVENEGCRVSISFKQLDRITVCQTKELALASGDRLLLKANGRSEDDRKLATGELVTTGKPRGWLHRARQADGRVLSPHFRQFVATLSRPMPRKANRSIMCCSQIQR